MTRDGPGRDDTDPSSREAARRDLEQVDALLKPFGVAATIIAAPWRELARAELIELARLPGKLSREIAKVDAPVRIKHLPSAAELEQARATLVEALEVSADRDMVSMSIARMLESGVRGVTPERWGYFEALVHDVLIENYSASVVAAACTETRRMAIYAPSVAEFLGTCAKKCAALRAAVAFIDRAIRTRRNAEDALIAIARLEANGIRKPDPPS
jgi:hypothetical protein